MRRLPVFVLLVALGCSSDVAMDPSFAVVDSAGVEVVSTSVPRWDAAGTPWRLTVDVEIGELEGDEPYLFGEPVTALRLSDGRVAVADAQSSDVRFFSPQGIFIGRAGRKGQGPGEFQSFLWLDRCGSGLLAYDWVQRRATPISLAGVIGDPFAVETPETGFPPYGLRCLPDGSFIASGWGERPAMPAGQDYMFYSQESEVWHLFPGSDSSVVIGQYISSERLALPVPHKVRIASQDEV